MNYEGQADQQRQVVPNALVSPLSLLCEIEIVDQSMPLLLPVTTRLSHSGQDLHSFIYLANKIVKFL